MLSPKLKSLSQTFPFSHLTLPMWTFVSESVFWLVRVLHANALWLSVRFFLTTCYGCN
jgi:hypothetical protein